MKKIIIKAMCSLLLITSIAFIFSKNSLAAPGIIPFLNGGTVAGYTDGVIKYGTVGGTLPINTIPTQPGYTFKGWLQQGNGGIGPWGTPLWADGEFVSKPVTDLYSTMKYPASVAVTKVAKPADCKTKSGTTIVRATWTENAHYVNYNRIGFLAGYYNVNPNSFVRTMMYAKIPVGYTVQASIGGATTPGSYYVGGDSTNIFVGTGEWQYYECIIFNGNGIQQLGIFGVVKSSDPSILEPSPTNPINIDIGYYNFTYCDGSSGHDFYNGTGTYKFVNPTFIDHMTAIYTPNSYTITYDITGGEGLPPEKQTYGYSTTKTIPLSAVSPTRVGFKFLGWSKEKGGSIETGPWSCSVMQNTTLYVVWEFTAFFNTKLPKTVICGSDGNGEFIIEGAPTVGKMTVTVPSSIDFKSENKPDISASLTLSSNVLDELNKSIIGVIKINNLTAGSWKSEFFIDLNYSLD